MLRFAFFFLRISVASRNKIAFCSGLWRALERLLLGTNLSSALDFGELWRGRSLEQNCILLWTLQSFGEVASPNKIAFRSGLWRRKFWRENFHRQQSLLVILESSPNYHTMLFDSIQSGPTMVWTNGQARGGTTTQVWYFLVHLELVRKKIGRSDREGPLGPYQDFCLPVKRCWGLVLT